MPHRSGDMQKEKRTMVVTIRLGENAVKELRALADADRRKLANYVSMILEDHLAHVRKEKDAKRPAGHQKSKP